jgi:hypothetical protein
MKIGDYVWYITTNRKRIGQILRLNPHRLDGSNVVISCGISELWRSLHEITPATDEEVMLWKLENS